MTERIIGQVRRVNGPVIEVKGVTDAMMMELVYVGEARLVGEVIKLDGQRAGRWNVDHAASAIAFVLGTHERLGVDSPVCMLVGESGLLEMIVRLWWYKATQLGVPKECVGLRRLLGFRGDWS